MLSIKELLNYVTPCQDLFNWKFNFELIGNPLRWHLQFVKENETHDTKRSIPCLVNLKCTFYHFETSKLLFLIFLTRNLINVLLKWIWEAFFAQQYRVFCFYLVSLSKFLLAKIMFNVFLMKMDRFISSALR